MMMMMMIQLIKHAVRFEALHMLPLLNRALYPFLLQIFIMSLSFSDEDTVRNTAWFCLSFDLLLRVLLALASFFSSSLLEYQGVVSRCCLWSVLTFCENKPLYLHFVISGRLFCKERFLDVTTRLPYMKVGPLRFLHVTYLLMVVACVTIGHFGVLLYHCAWDEYEYYCSEDDVDCLVQMLSQSVRQWRWTSARPRRYSSSRHLGTETGNFHNRTGKKKIALASFLFTVRINTCLAISFSSAATVLEC